MFDSSCPSRKSNSLIAVFCFHSGVYQNQIQRICHLMQTNQNIGCRLPYYTRNSSNHMHVMRAYFSILLLYQGLQTLHLFYKINNLKSIVMKMPRKLMFMKLFVLLFLYRVILPCSHTGMIFHDLYHFSGFPGLDFKIGGFFF